LETRLQWAGTYLNFQNSYEDIDSVPNARISSWVTFDSSAGYDLRLGRTASSAMTRLSFSARNVFNHQPPFLMSQDGIGYDEENASLLGRIVSFSVRQKW
jgi:hypothetical protein